MYVHPITCMQITSLAVQMRRNSCHKLMQCMLRTDARTFTQTLKLQLLVRTVQLIERFMHDMPIIVCN